MGKTIQGDAKRIAKKYGNPLAGNKITGTKTVTEVAKGLVKKNKRK